MESLTREAILRMVGLHDAAHMMRQLNAIQLSMEEEQGRMVTYWTEIRKSEKEVTLLAGRMTDAETDIGQLQVTAQQITASVSSLTTTVNGDGTQGSGLVSQVSSLSLTVGNINLSVQSLSTTVNGDGTQGSGLVSRVSSLELTESSISQRVGVIEGDYVKEAEISLMVKKDSSGYISNALIKADIIDFTFTQSTNFNSGGQTVMNINSSGDLWIKGDLKGGNIQGNYAVGTQGYKMEIYSDETQPNGSKTSGIRGLMDDGTQCLNLGFNYYSNFIFPELIMSRSGIGYTSVHVHELTFGDSNGAIQFAMDNNGALYLFAALSRWPSLGNVSVGQVYLDNGYLKVRTS